MSLVGQVQALSILDGGLPGGTQRVSFWVTQSLVRGRLCDAMRFLAALDGFHK